MTSQQYSRDRATNLYFLDSYMFKHTRTSLGKSQAEIPAEFLQLVEDGAQVLQDVNTYFACIHPVLPISTIFSSI